MFNQQKCLVTSCKKSSLSSFDENGNILESRHYCLDHIPNPGKIKEEIYEYIRTHEKIVGLNASGLMFTDLDISGKKFYGCDFSNCTFQNISSRGMRSRLSVFDFAVFNDCNLIESNIMFSSFSGCTFSHTLFTSSEIIQSNYNGSKAFQCSFDDSDLYNSRFIKSELVDTSFRNCNLKKVDFFESYRRNVSFKMSNTREALFTRYGSDIFLGEDQDSSVFEYSNPEEAPLPVPPVTQPGSADAGSNANETSGGQK